VVAEAHLPFREATHVLGLEDAFAEEASFPKVTDAVAAFEQQEAPKG
jgi:hypothetical protein